MKPPPRFVADAMLGSLARKLRIFGFDTLYFKEGSDTELLSIARKEKRVVITSDRVLFRRSGMGGVRGVLVEGRSDRSKLLSLIEQTGVEVASLTYEGRASRCAVCNGELEALGRRDAAQAAIPPKVLARHRLFFRCSSCSRLYWRGKHWVRLRRLSYSLKAKVHDRNVERGASTSLERP